MNRKSIKELTKAMDALNRQIKELLSVSEYMDYEDLCALQVDWDNPNELQLAEEYRRILEKCRYITEILDYLNRPICEISRLSRNADGRFETKAGHFYTCGKTIEYLSQDKCDGRAVWRISSVRHNGIDYYIVSEYPKISMTGIMVRVRE